MKFVIVLAAVAIEYFLRTEKLNRFSWYPRYLNWVQGKLSHLNVWILLFLCLIFPTLCILIIKGFLQAIFHGAAAFVMGVAVLVYCLGPDNIFSLLKELLEEVKQAPFCAKLLKKLAKVDLPANDPKALDKRLAQVLLSRLNHALFAPLFWFMFFGVFGALFYRLVYLLSPEVGRAFNHEELGDFVRPLLAALEWVPARILALLYAACGNFSGGLKVLQLRAFSSLYDNDPFLEEAGLAALASSKVADDPHALLADTEESQGFLKRVLIVICVLCALFTIL